MDLILTICAKATWDLNLCLNRQTEGKREGWRRPKFYCLCAALGFLIVWLPVTHSKELFFRFYRIGREKNLEETATAYGRGAKLDIMAVELLRCRSKLKGETLSQRQ